MNWLEKSEAADIAAMLRKSWDLVNVEEETSDGIRIVASDIDNPDFRLVCLVYVEDN
jgi:hypothetical protein